MEDSKKYNSNNSIAVTMDSKTSVHSVANDKEKPLIGKRPLKTFLIDLTIWSLMTAYAVALFILGKGKDGYVVALGVYVFLTLRFLARHVSMSKIFYVHISNFMDATIVKAVTVIPKKLRLPIFALLVIAMMVAVSMLIPLTKLGSIPARLQSLGGVFGFLALLYATSNNRKAVPWRTVIVGILLQFIIALFVLKTTIGVKIFSYLASLITNFLEMSHLGLEFLFGPVAKTNFAVNVLPAIIFFCSFISIVYYFGGMQYVVKKMGWLMMRLMDTSGAESVVAAASPFVGQGESALLVKPFVQYMTKSELHSTMTSGFSTIAGSVLLAYIGFLENDTSSLLTACIMSVPCSLAVSKIRYPETEQPITKGKVNIPENEEKEANFLHAAGNGAATGVHLVLLISASLLSIVTLFEVANYLCGWAFDMVGIRDTVNDPIDGVAPLITIQFLLSYIFSPAAFIMGIPAKNCRKAAEFMAAKMVVNEFFAYKSLAEYALGDNRGAFDDRTVKILSFALCGFANVASIGIQIGCLSAMAPNQSRNLATLAFSAMVTGTISTWMCAAVAGTLM